MLKFKIRNLFWTRLFHFAEGDGDGGDGGGSDTGGGGDGSDTSSETNYYDGVVNNETKTWVKEKGYKTVEDQISAHHELHRTIGAMVKPPTDESSDEDWAAFGKKVGAKDVSEYNVELPKGLEDYFNTKVIDAVKAKALEDGVPGRYVRRILANYFEAQVGEIKDLEIEAAKIAKEDKEALKKDWGEKYNENNEFQKRGWEAVARAVKIKATDFTAFMKETGFDTHPIMKKIGLYVGRLHADAPAGGGSLSDDDKGSSTSVMPKGFYDKVDGKD